jgi:CHASE2 domain-containing sensor protein
MAGAGAGPGLLAAVLCVFQPACLTRIDDALYDRLVRAAGPRPTSGRVVIVDVDERSLDKVGQWPWPRTRVASLVDELRQYGAATVAIDIVFAEPERSPVPGVSADAALAASLGAGRAVLGYALTFEATGERAPECLRHPLNVGVIAPASADAAITPFFRATRAVCNVEVLTAAAPSSGFLNAAPDSDGILRRVPVLLEFNDRTYPSLALAAVSSVDEVRGTLLRIANVNTAHLELSGAGDRSRSVPVDGRSNLLVRYRGRKQTFPYVSAVDVLERKLPPGALSGKIVFLGTTALGTREVVATPLDTLFTGVEVQATVADNLLQQDFLRRPEHAVSIEALTTVAVAAVVAATAASAGLGWGLGAAAVLLGGLWAGAVTLLNGTGLVLSPLYPMLGLAAGIGAIGVVGLAVERQRAEHAGAARAASQRLMVQTLLSLVEVRDAETGRHSRRTQQYTRVLAEALSAHPSYREQLSADRIDRIATLAPLHDIGKVGVPDHILHKTGKLTPDEWAEMRKHPIYGRAVIINAERAAGVRDDETLAIAKEIVYAHHERWDGTGYPEGLAGEQIPTVGRLIALVDVYDAMRSPRPYHRAMAHEEVAETIVRGRGTHFDPAVVDAFVAIAPAMKSLSELEQRVPNEEQRTKDEERNVEP